MNTIKEIKRINERETSSGAWSDSASWHAQYKDTSWIFAGGLPYDLTEGDIICIFSQYGEIINIELARDAKDGKSKGFAFIQYEDQRSTILAVDNLNGTQILGRTIRVDHSYGPKARKKKEGDEYVIEEYVPKMNAAPEMIYVEAKPKETPKEEDDLDAEDPMAEYFRNKKKSKSPKEKKDKKDKKDKKEKKEKKHKKEKSERHDKYDKHYKHDRHERHDSPDSQDSQDSRESHDSRDLRDRRDTRDRRDNIDSRDSRDSRDRYRSRDRRDRSHSRDRYGRHDRSDRKRSRDRYSRYSDDEDDAYRSRRRHYSRD